MIAPYSCAVQLRVQSGLMEEKIAQQLKPYINENTLMKRELEANRREMENLRAALALADDDVAPAGDVDGQNTSQTDSNSAHPFDEERPDGRRMKSILKQDAQKDGASTTSDYKLSRSVSLPKVDSPHSKGNTKEQCQGPLRSTSGQAGSHQRAKKTNEHSLRTMLRHASVNKVLRSSLS